MTFKAQQRRWRAYGWTTFALGILCDIAGAALVATGGGAVLGLALIAAGVGFNSASTATFLHLNYIQYKNGKISAEEYQTDKKLAKISYGLNVGAGFISGAAPAVKLANPKFYAKCTGFLASKFGTAANAATKGGEAATDPLTASLRNSVSQTSRRSSKVGSNIAELPKNTLEHIRDLNLKVEEGRRAFSGVNDFMDEIYDDVERQTFSSKGKPLQKKSVSFAGADYETDLPSSVKNPKNITKRRNYIKTEFQDDVGMESATKGKHEYLSKDTRRFDYERDFSVYKENIGSSDLPSNSFGDELKGEINLEDKLMEGWENRIKLKSTDNSGAIKLGITNRRTTQQLFAENYSFKSNFDKISDEIDIQNYIRKVQNRKITYANLVVLNSSNFLKLGFYAKKKIEE